MRLLFSFLLTMFCVSLWAQKAPNYFHAISVAAVALPETAQREFEPLKYTAYTLDFETLKAQLSTAPREFTDEATQRVCSVILPLADGTMEEFVMLKTSPMAPALEAQHPEIMTLAGTSLHSPGMRVRITITPHWGLRVMIFRADKGIEKIIPIALGQNQYYMSYDPIYEPKDPLEGTMPTQFEAPLDLSQIKEQSAPRFSPGNAKPTDGNLLEHPVILKKYRFACACTGEFSVSLGGNKDVIFQKITDIVNGLNAIYERDINIRLELIPESYDIIFLDPATDPYPGTTVFGWLNANSSAMITVLGTDTKYDIGHVFAKYIEGAAIGVAGGLCCTQSKGKGCSAGYGPPYENFFYTVAGQEIGHMWSGGHTFNQCNLADQFNYNSACEPGSGSTIMSYNGSCGANNISGGNALYYHICSIAEIRNFVEFQEGATCGSNLNTGNNPPVVSTLYPDNMFIPISTPFELTGTAIDPDGDTNLTYCWDEIDLGPTTTLGNPVGDSPLFRWFTPTATPSRTFPRIQNVVANNSNAEEVLPTYNRNVTMVLVVRDNKLGGGGVGYDTVYMQSTTSAGPFRLSYPNLGTNIWYVGEYQTVTWDVANTNNTLVNCQKINIRLSNDGGFTYPITLASNVPNIGKACIQVPDNIGNNMRVRVEAADNVFFDISNANFNIQQPSSPGFTLCAGNLKGLVCLPAPFSTEISTSALASFSDPILLSATGLPNGATATFSPNPVPAGSNATLTIEIPANAVESTFDVTVVGTAGAGTASSVITLTTVQNNFSTLLPTAPVNGASGVNTQPLIQWNTAADATSYDLELATNPSFAPNTVVTTKNTAIGSYQVTTGLAEGGVYFWRIRAKNECGNGTWSETQVFVVNVLSCAQLTCNDVPKNISANGTPTVELKINVFAAGLISDVNVKRVQGYHEYFKDLEAHLISPAGTDVLLWKDRCSSYNGGFNISFDDGAGAVFTCPPPNNNTASKTNGLLSAFNGQNALGEWTLRVKDNTQSSGGAITGFELQICANEATNPPLIIANNLLTLPSGTNATIDASLLKAEDSNNTPDQLVFTLISIPQNGLLQMNGGDQSVGAQFTQTDIDNGSLRYFDYGLNAGPDAFRFVVSDNEGGMATGTFQISPLVGTKDLVNALRFDLSPNPANEVLRLSLSQPLQSDAQVSMYNSAGQRVRTYVLAAGNTFLSLQIADLPDGVYAVSIGNDAVRSVKKVVVR